MIRRGEIWWASLPEPQGSSPGYKRPVLVIQANEFNESRINTVVVAAISSNLALAEAPGNKLIRPKASGLPRNSVINVSQIITIDKRFLTKRVRRLEDAELKEIDAGLRLVLSL